LTSGNGIARITFIPGQNNSGVGGYQGHDRYGMKRHNVAAGSRKPCVAGVVPHWGAGMSPTRWCIFPPRFEAGAASERQLTPQPVFYVMACGKGRGARGSLGDFTPQPLADVIQRGNSQD